MCAKYWQDGPAKNGSLESQTPVWPSKEACCQAGGGAYVNGVPLHQYFTVLPWLRCLMQ